MIRVSVVARLIDRRATLSDACYCIYLLCIREVVVDESKSKM